LSDNVHETQLGGRFLRQRKANKGSGRLSNTAENEFLSLNVKKPGGGLERKNYRHNLFLGGGDEGGKNKTLGAFGEAKNNSTQASDILRESGGGREKKNNPGKRGAIHLMAKKTLYNQGKYSFSYEK